MAGVNEVELLPDPEQHKLLGATLERANRASQQARATALQHNVFAGTQLRDVVKAEVERAKLPDAFVKPIVDRVEVSLQRRAGKQQKFSTYQSLALPPSAFKWSTSDRVAMLTAAGRRTIAVRVDRSRGDLRPPLSGRPTMLVFRNGEFELWAADVIRHSEDDDQCSRH
ncbi:MAG: hypothetical protein ACT4OX_11145 [Actinomycetota bacterium]